MTYSPVIMQGLSFFQHIGEIFKMEKVIDVIGKTFFRVCSKSISDITTVRWYAWATCATQC